MSRKKNKPKPKQKSSGKPKSAKKQARIPKANKPAKTSTKPRITRTSKNKSPQVEETHDPSSPDPRLRVKAFFANYPGFRYNPSRPVMEEFYRLCDITWPDRGDWERDIAWRGFRDALTQQFNDIYGTDEQSLTNWQNLCVALQLRNIPEELNECRETHALLELRSGTSKASTS
ncbi:hypothetical protein FRC09_019363 [Ceratobasidium sp. 395]|nr:hypothetical protein FRC09_019363 [Ceratobasidium sp. 395]